MSPEFKQPEAENTNAEIAFVQQALAAADKSERFSRIIVGVLVGPSAKTRETSTAGPGVRF